MRLLRQFIALHKREGFSKTLPLVAFLFSGVLTTIVACLLFYQNENRHSQSEFNNEASHLLWNYEHELNRVQYYLKTIRSHFEEQAEINQDYLTNFTYPYLKHEPQVIGIRWIDKPTTSSETQITNSTDKKSIIFEEPIIDTKNKTVKGVIALELSPNILSQNLKEYLNTSLDIKANISSTSGDILYMSSNKPQPMHSGWSFLYNKVEHKFALNNSNWTVIALPIQAHLGSSSIYSYLFALLLSGIAITLITFMYLVKSTVQKHETERVVVRKTKALQQSNKQLEEQKTTILEMLSTTKEQKLIAEQSRDSKANFLSVMSHEIRTPLNAVIGFTHILKDKIQDKNLAPHIQGLSFAGKTLLTLVNDILDLSKIEKGKLKPESLPFELDQLLENISNTHMAHFHEKQLEYTSQIATPIANNLIGDPFRLTQIFNNLISNAIKFTATGKIETSVSVLQEEDSSIVLRFEISDTGIGIPKSRLNSIFDNFEQADTSTSRKYGGTGLGLGITKKIVEALGGKIRVHSHVQIGSTFSFDLPFKTENDHSQPIDKQTNTPHLLKGKTILLVDDNPINLLIAKNYLENWNVIVTTATNGSHAFQIAKKEYFDFILMDLHMPVTDGYTATHLIKKDTINSDTPIYALTADTYHEDKEKLFKAGFESLIPKPIDPEKLYRTLVKQSNKNLLQSEPFE